MKLLGATDPEGEARAGSKGVSLRTSTISARKGLRFIEYNVMITMSCSKSFYGQKNTFEPEFANNKTVVPTIDL